MITIFISAAAAAAIYLLTFFVCHFSLTWSIVCAILALFAAQIIMALLLRKIMKKMNEELQQVMTATQRKIEFKQQQFVRQRMSNQKLILQTLEREQNNGLAAAIAVCDKFMYLNKWNRMIGKQINTMRMAFYYQMRDWEKVDKLMPKCVFMDPQSISMRLARMYMTKDPQLDKFYQKKARMFRKDNVILPASTYAWILLKQNREDDAFKVLTKAATMTSNEVIHRNRDFLANKKARLFSNSALNEMWYALALEELRMPRSQQKYVYR